MRSRKGEFNKKREDNVNFSENGRFNLFRKLEKIRNIGIKTLEKKILSALYLYGTLFLSDALFLRYKWKCENCCHR